MKLSDLRPTPHNPREIGGGEVNGFSLDNSCEVATMVYALYGLSEDEIKIVDGK
jgi:hypothetical protein